MKYLVWLLVFLVTCCSAFKKTTKTTNKSLSSSDRNMKLSTDVETQKSKSMQYFTFHHDSVQADYTLRLWPRGRINFSESSGFTGSFDSILMTGHRTGSLKSKGRLVISEQDGMISHHQIQEDRKDKSTQKETVVKRLPDVKWMIIVIVCVLLIIYLILKRYFL
jgi:hypothetical protein